MNNVIRVGNTDIGPSTDLLSLLRRQLTGGGPLSGRYDETPEQGAISLFSAVRNTPFETAATQAVSQLLTDANLDVRAGAVAIVEDFPTYFDSAQILELLSNSPDLYMGVGKNQFGRQQPDLAWALMRAMAASPAPTREVRDRLRLAVQDPSNGDRVLAGVTANDADWVMNHSIEVIQGDPTRAWIILLNLDTANRERLIRTLPRESPQVHEAVRKGIERAITNASQRTQLLTLLDGKS